MLKAVITLILLVPVVARADVDATECKVPANVTFSVVNYYSKSATFIDTDPLCDGKGASLTCRQYGLLYLPKNAVNRPAVVFNHGRDKNKDIKKEFCATVEYFLNHGFVVFVPRRRGIDGDFQPHKNTGVYFDDTMDEVKKGNIPSEVRQYKQDCKLKQDRVPDEVAHQCVLSHLLRGEALELKAAIAWLRALGHPDDGFKKYVDARKVVLIGHSRGSITSLYAAIDLPDYYLPALVIALDTAEKGWEKSGLGLTEAIDKIKLPVMLLQPGNAISLESSKMLGTRLAAARKPFLAEKLPAVIPEDPNNPEDGIHIALHTREDQLAIWGPLALAFMELYGVK